MRRCSKCKETKSINQFNKNRAQADGFDSYCKRCRKIVNDEQSSGKDNPVAVDKKRCRKCLETKPAEEFSRNKVVADGLHSWCKTCVNACNRARRAKKARK